MITSVSIGNFKAFGETQEIPIRPITLVFGPNSGGKSSLLQSLLLFHEIERKSEARWEWSLEAFGGHRVRTYLPDWNVRHTALSGDLVDLGGFTSYVHCHDQAKTVTLGIGMDLKSFHARNVLESLIGDEKTPKNRYLIGIPDDLRELSISIQFGYEDRHQRIHVRHAELSLGDTWLLKLNRLDYSDDDEDCLAVQAVNGNHPFLRSFRGKLTVRPPDEPCGCSVTAFPEYLLKAQGFGPCEVSPLGQIVVLSRRLIREVCRSFYYLGGLRALPPRLLPVSDRMAPNWHSSGMAAYAAMLENSEALAKVNHYLTSPDFLNTSVELRLRRNYDLAKIDPSQLAHRLAGKSAKAAARHAKEFFADLEQQSVPELYFWDRRSQTAVSHRDLGLGVSQMLPVLALAHNRDYGFNIIEQPELHLHPGLQSRMADIFIHSALPSGGAYGAANHFLLETHSEHLILRFLRRVRETTLGTLPKGFPPVRPDDISVVYLQPSPEGVKAVALPVTADGDFATPWPNGFFNERAQELF